MNRYDWMRNISNMLYYPTWVLWCYIPSTIQCKLKWVYLFIHKGQSFRWQPTHLYTQIHKNVEDCRGTQVQEVQLVITAFIWNLSILRHIKRLFSFYCFFCSHNDFGIYFIYHRINNLAREIRHSCLVSCSPLLLRN